MTVCVASSTAINCAPIAAPMPRITDIVPIASLVRSSGIAETITFGIAALSTVVPNEITQSSTITSVSELGRPMPANQPPENRPAEIGEVKFLTVAEVAATMRVSKMTVYRLVHNGELPAVQVGRSFRINEDDVNEYLRKSFYSAG